MAACAAGRAPRTFIFRSAPQVRLLRLRSSLAWTIWPIAISRRSNARWRRGHRRTASRGGHDLRGRRHANPARARLSSIGCSRRSPRGFPLAEGGEWTVEANPGTLDEAKADVLAGGGVNRVSLGAQSFQPDLLRVLERNHAPDEVGRALDLVRPVFPRWSFDLIFGVPGSHPRDLGSATWRSRSGLEPRAPVLLRPGLREGNAALEAVADRARQRGR